MSRVVSVGVAGALSADQATDILRHLRRGGYLVVYTGSKAEKTGAASRTAWGLVEEGILDRQAMTEVEQRLVDSTWELSPPGFHRMYKEDPNRRCSLIFSDEQQNSIEDELLAMLKSAGIVPNRDADKEALLRAIYEGDAPKVAALTQCSEEFVAAIRGVLGWVSGIQLPLRVR